MNEIDKRELDAYIEQENPAYSDDKKDYFYPYCGYELGFCTLGNPCELPYGDHKDCPYLMEIHLLTGEKPQGIYSSLHLEWLELQDYLEEDDTD